MRGFVAECEGSSILSIYIRIDEISIFRPSKIDGTILA